MSKINKKYKVPTAFQSEITIDQDLNKTEKGSKKHNLISSTAKPKSRRNYENLYKTSIPSVKPDQPNESSKHTTGAKYYRAQNKSNLTSRCLFNHLN